MAINFENQTSVKNKAEEEVSSVETLDQASKDLVRQKFDQDNLEKQGQQVLVDKADLIAAQNYLKNKLDEEASSKNNSEGQNLDKIAEEVAASYAEDFKYLEFKHKDDPESIKSGKFMLLATDDLIARGNKILNETSNQEVKGKIQDGINQLEEVRNEITKSGKLINPLAAYISRENYTKNNDLTRTLRNDFLGSSKLSFADKLITKAGFNDNAAYGNYLKNLSEDPINSKVIGGSISQEELSNQLNMVKRVNGVIGGGI
ncbi:MAG: hypothetical protein ACOYMB_03550 [Patescibacteria group bacterium]